jgi:hypothetical protein
MMFAHLFLGSSCPGSVVLPEDFMTTSEAKPLPKATPTSASSAGSGTNLWSWLIGGAVTVGVILVASGSVPLLANPDERRTVKWIWENVVEPAARENAVETFDYPKEDRLNHGPIWHRVVHESAMGIIDSLTSEREFSNYGLDKPINYKMARALGKMSQELYGQWAAPRNNPGLAQKRGFTKADADPGQLRKGIKHELEHTDSRKVAERIALDHLAEDPAYYTHLDKMERMRK